ncbi:MAG: AarF/ABC1/UbiB kinase family protein [Candidatus Micrarchaeota archaeon]
MGALPATGKYDRMKEIAGILAKHGFEEFLSLVDESSTNKVVQRVVSQVFPRKEKTPLGVRIRTALIDLGPTFVKFGQLLSSRADMLPPDVVQELEKLQDQVPSFDYAQVERIITKELGDPKKIFRKIEKKPLAAASIGQVHKAVLLNGDNVIIKVQRPGIEEKVEADIQILTDLAGFVEEHVPETRFYHPIEIVKQFAHTIRREMDFVHEARSNERFRKNFEKDETVFIPRVYMTYTTRRVLVQEFVPGVKITQATSYAMPRRKKIVERGANAIIRQVLVYGLFQADPHPGNLIVMKKDVVGIVDFGMTGFIDTETRDEITDFFLALIRKDTDALVDYFMKVGAISSDTNVSAFRADLAEVIEQYYDFPLEQMRFDEIVRDLIDLAREYKVRMPPKAMLLFRLLVTLEGLGRRIYPKFNTVKAVQPVAEDLLKRRTAPDYVLRKSLGKVTAISDSFARIPVQLSKILGKVEQDKLELNIEHHGLEEPIFKLDKAINKVSISLLIASLSIASALIVLADKGPHIIGYPVLGMTGFLIAALASLVVLARVFASKEF